MARTFPLANLPDNIPKDTAVAVVRGIALREVAQARAVLQAFAALKRGRPAAKRAMLTRHKQEKADALAAIAAARAAFERLQPRHAAEISREADNFAHAAARAEGALEKFHRSKEQLRLHRDPEPYRHAALRRRADAMAVRVLKEQLFRAAPDISPADAAFALITERTTPSTIQLIIDKFRAEGRHDRADALEAGPAPPPAAPPPHLSSLIGLKPDEHSTGAMPHQDEAVTDLTQRLPLGARTAAAHLARSIDATDLFANHTMPIDQQLMHKDISRNPITPLNWRDRDHLRELLSYLPRPARTAAVNRLADGVPNGTTNPLYRPDVPDYGHARTFLFARDAWGATDTAARKVAEPGADQRRLDLAGRTVEGVLAKAIAHREEDIRTDAYVVGLDQQHP